MTRLRGTLFVLPAALVFLFIFVVPQVWLIGTSFGWPGRATLSIYMRFFDDAYNLRLLFRSVALGAIVTAVTLILGFPLAYVLARLNSRFVPILLLVVSFPLWISALIRS